MTDDDLVKQIIHLARRLTHEQKREVIKILENMLGLRLRPTLIIETYEPIDDDDLY